MTTMTDRMFEQTTFQTGIAQICDLLRARADGRLNQLMDMYFVAADGPAHSITLRISVQDWQLNQNETMHGGALATAFDNTMGILSNYIAHAQKQVAVTAHLNVRFLKPIPHFDQLILSARVVSSDRRLLTLVSEAKIQSTNLLAATADSSFLLISPPPRAQLLRPAVR